MATIDNLSIQVTANADSAARALDRLASSAGGLRGAATRAGGGMRDLAAGARDAGTATQEAGTQVGNAERHTRNYGRAAEEAGKAAKRGTAGIATFWQALKRVAYYRFIRTIIKTITTSFKEGTEAVYKWSKAQGGEFAKNIRSISSSVNLLKGSLGTLAVPLVNALTPALNTIINLCIDVINAFNMMLSALSGSSTYTVAVRNGGAVGNVLQQISENADDAAASIKKTILGFDEINKLQKDNSGGGGSGGGRGGGLSGISFEERPLEGFWAKLSDFTSGMPDWLKWLFGGAVLIGGFKLITDFIPWLLGKLADLFSIKIPDWIKWLFGPKGSDDVGIDIPEHIELPDGKVKVDVEKGDWSALDELNDKDVKITPKLDNTGTVLWNTLKNEWDSARTPLYASPKLDNTGAVLWNAFKGEWDGAGSKTLYLSPKLDNTAKTLYANFKSEWDAQGSKVLYFSPKLDNGANTLYTNFKSEWDSSGSKTLYFSPKLDNTAKTLYDGFISDWNNAGSKTLYFSPKLDNTAKVLYNGFISDWNNAGSKTLYFSPKLDNTGNALWLTLKSQWDAVEAKILYASPILDNTAFALWSILQTEWNGLEYRILFASPMLDNTASALWKGLKKEWEDLDTRTLFASPMLDNTASALWKGLKKEWEELKSHSLYASPKLDNTGSALFTVLKQSWNNVKTKTLYASPKLDNTGSALWRAFKKEWDNAKTNLTANVILKEEGGRVPTVGGGGETEGGGAGRGRALGGIFQNGLWSAIPQYAGGTTNAHGSLFMAGEAGPEIVGHVGGRTEVLNRSQLASTMYAAVRSAMGGVRLTLEAGDSGAQDNREADYETMYRAMYDAFSAAMARGDERDREKVALLRQISEKEFRTDISTSDINRAQTRANRRAGITVVPVGT